MSHWPESYISFGKDPFILSVDVTPVRFSAWDFARERCAVMRGAPC